MDTESLLLSHARRFSEDVEVGEVLLDGVHWRPGLGALADDVTRSSVWHAATEEPLTQR